MFIDRRAKILRLLDEQLRVLTERRGQLWAELDGHIIPDAESAPLERQDSEPGLPEKRKIEALRLACGFAGGKSLDAAAVAWVAETFEAFLSGTQKLTPAGSADESSGMGDRETARAYAEAEPQRLRDYVQHDSGKDDLAIRINRALRALGNTLCIPSEDNGLITRYVELKIEQAFRQRGLKT